MKYTWNVTTVKIVNKSNHNPTIGLTIKCKKLMSRVNKVWLAGQYQSFCMITINTVKTFSAVCERYRSTWEVNKSNTLTISPGWIQRIIDKGKCPIHSIHQNIVMKVVFRQNTQVQEAKPLRRKFHWSGFWKWLKLEWAFVNDEWPTPLRKVLKE